MKPRGKLIQINQDHYSGYVGLVKGFLCSCVLLMATKGKWVKLPTVVMEAPGERKERGEKGE